MTIGRSNNDLSETRSSVSWKVERAPNSGKNCFGRTSREAGHSRVPAPPHMIRGIMRFSLVISNLEVVPVPGDEIAAPDFDRSGRCVAGIAQQVRDISKGLQNVSRLHRQHVLDRRPAQLAFDEPDDVHQLFRPIVADIVDPGRRICGSRNVRRYLIDQPGYYTGDA